MVVVVVVVAVVVLSAANLCMPFGGVCVFFDVVWGVGRVDKTNFHSCVERKNETKKPGKGRVFGTTKNLFLLMRN